MSHSLIHDTHRTTTLTIADTAVRTASVLLVRSDFAVSCRRTSAGAAGTACPVHLDTSGAAVLEVLLRAGNLYDLTDCEEREAGGVLEGENAGGREGDEQELLHLEVELGVVCVGASVRW